MEHSTLISQEQPYLQKMRKSLSNRVLRKGNEFAADQTTPFHFSLISSEEIIATLKPHVHSMYFYLKRTPQSSPTTKLILSGLEPNTPYIKCTDSLEEQEEFIADEFGQHTYYQNIEVPHIVFIQSKTQILYLTDDGWSDPDIGTWNPQTRIATLTKDVRCPIEIKGDNLTLDGCRHYVFGEQGMVGIYIDQCRHHITIRNIGLANFQIGIFIHRNNTHIQIQQSKVIAYSAVGILFNYNNSFCTIQNNIIESNHGNSTAILFIRENNTFNTICNNKIDFCKITANCTLSNIGIFCIDRGDNHNIITDNYFSFSHNTINEHNAHFTAVLLSNELSGENTIQGNRITIEQNVFSSTATEPYWEIYGIATGALSGHICIDRNEICFRNNSFSSINTSQHVELTGIYLNRNNGGFSLNQNYIEISHNKLDTDNGQYSLSYFTGIELESHNGGNTITENHITINHNCGRFRDIPLLKHCAANIQFEEENCGNALNENHLALCKNSLATINCGKQQANLEYYNIQFQQKNSGNICCNNHLEIMDNEVSSYCTHQLTTIFINLSLEQGNSGNRNSTNKFMIASNTISNDEHCSSSLFLTNAYFTDENNANTLSSSQFTVSNNNLVDPYSSKQHQFIALVFFYNNNGGNTIQHNSISYSQGNGIQFICENCGNLIYSNRIIKNYSTGILFAPYGNQVNGIVDNSIAKNGTNISIPKDDCCFTH